MILIRVTSQTGDKNHYEKRKETNNAYWQDIRL